MREPLHERRANFDSTVARRAAKADEDDGFEEYDLGGGPKKRRAGGEVWWWWKHSVTVAQPAFPFEPMPQGRRTLSGLLPESLLLLRN